MDDAIRKNREPNPRETAGFFSSATFFYAIPTLIKGRRKELTEDDIYETYSTHKSSKLGGEAEKLWNQELEKCKMTNKSPSFKKVLLKLFVYDFCLCVLGHSIVDLFFRPLQVIALGYLISFYMDESKREVGNPYLYTAAILALNLLVIFLMHPSYMFSLHTGMKMRIVSCCLIYRKALRLNQSAFKHTTAGQMITLLSNDVNIFDRFMVVGPFVIVVPTQLLIFACIMYKEFGVAAIIGVIVLILFVPLQFFFGKLSGKFRMKTALRTDERVRIMNDVIRGIQIIKMYAWERPFAKIVALARRFEIKSIRISAYIKSTYSFQHVFVSVPLFLTIIAYVFFGNTIDARRVYILTSLYNLVGYSMASSLSEGLGVCGELPVSCARILKFLLNEEAVLPSSNYESKQNSVTLTKVSAKWDITRPQNTLTNINVAIKQGSLVAVIGPVGCGKTSMLHCILRELEISSGSLAVNGSISYASQEPWLFNSSIKQNILFGSEMNKKRYKDIVQICALEKDLKELTFGDETIVGERGASLSGGQRARINLARAVYREADIYLLDDPLSAVDAHVAKQIFGECIQGFLKDKTVVLVTHQLQYLRYVDHIIAVEDGLVKVDGSPTDLRNSNNDFWKWMDSDQNLENSKTVERQNLHDYDEVAKVGPKVVLEQKSIGTVSFHVYKDYLAACANNYLVILSCVLFILVQVTVSGSNYFMAHWVNYEQILGTNSSNVSVLEPNVYTEQENSKRSSFVSIYTGITVTTIILTLFRNIVTYQVCMRSSTRLHDSMFDSIIHATIQFFNTNSSGRILNRFAKDMGIVDELLPNSIVSTFQMVFTVIGIMIVVCFVNFWFIIPSVIVLLLFNQLKNFYLSSSLSMKRLEGITRSPIFGHLNGTLQGLTTIRAFGAQDILKAEFDERQDVHSCCYYMFLSTSRVFGYYLDWMAFAYIATLTFILVVISNEKYGGNIGLVLTQAIQMVGRLQYGVRQYTEMENLMTSVERVLEYNSIEHERSLDSLSTCKPPKNWPAFGKIIFNNVCLKYSQTEMSALKKLSFSIQPRQKIGIVGRTGAGKSSIISAIFQLADTEGLILIDDINIKDIGLHDLRSKISVIPQDPVLFTGTVRNNLDPFDEYTDEILWKALEEVKLMELVGGFNSGLNMKISEGGSNFSMGERQLICLARAIIRNNTILILDEATANVDHQTDAIIQETIKDKFANCTVLTVAHRLQTVMDSDKILVMDAGEMVEFDHPHSLLKNKGTFYLMVQTERESYSN